MEGITYFEKHLQRSWRMAAALLGVFYFVPVFANKNCLVLIVIFNRFTESKYYSNRQFEKSLESPIDNRPGQIAGSRRSTAINHS
jgi:hypothetical protein